MDKKTLTHIMSIAILGIVTLAAVLLFFKYVKITEPYGEPVETINHFDIQTEETEPDTEIVDTDESQNGSTASPCILQATDPAGSDYLEKIVFIGDRTIGKMTEYAIVELPDPTQQVWSTAENISVYHLMEVDSFLYPKTNEYVSYLTAIKDRRPQFLILTFGSYTDDDTEVDKNDFLSAYSEFIINLRAASPNTHIIIQSILPVGKGCSVIDSDTIKERNAWLIELCEGNRLYYLDTWSALSDTDGYLQLQYYNPDNLQETYKNYYLNEVGYRKMVDYVRTHVHPLYTEPLATTEETDEFDMFF